MNGTCCKNHPRVPAVKVLSGMVKGRRFELGLCEGCLAVATGTAGSFQRITAANLGEVRQKLRTEIKAARSVQKKLRGAKDVRVEDRRKK